MGFTRLELHTDGSAAMGAQWPAIPLSAGWGVVCFAVTPSQSRFLGALWWPVGVDADSPYYLRATKPTSPVAELTAIMVQLRLLRKVGLVGTTT
jgi:hypothetical protein